MNGKRRKPRTWKAWAVLESTVSRGFFPSTVHRSYAAARDEVWSIAEEAVQVRITEILPRRKPR